MYTPLPYFPDLGPGQTLEPGVVRHEVPLGYNPLYDGLAPHPSPFRPTMPPRSTRPGHSGKLWVYLPSGDHEPQSLPCILIAGAGTNLMTGMALGEGDVPEHLPWVRAGFAVVAYELDGMLPNRDDPTDAELKAAMQAFYAARAGLINAKIAIEYALRKVPQVDPKRMYAVGHSSAGTMALLFAEHEPRLAGCVAFAPVADTEASLDGLAVRIFSLAVPGLRTNIARYSPRNHEIQLRCPVLLFHAEDDGNVPVEESRKCAARLQALRKTVTLQTVPTGDHYDSMIDQGVPLAIRWVQNRPDAAVGERAERNPTVSE